jgi:hypothetical protein
MNNARLSEISDEVLDVGRAYFVQWSVAEMVQKRLQAIVNRVRQGSLFAMAWRSLYTLANSRNDNGPVVACKECSSNVPSRIAARSSSSGVRCSLAADLPARPLCEADPPAAEAPPPAVVTTIPRPGTADPTVPGSHSVALTPLQLFDCREQRRDRRAWSLALTTSKRERLKTPTVHLTRVKTP